MLMKNERMAEFQTRFDDRERRFQHSRAKSFRWKVAAAEEAALIEEWLAELSR